MFSYIVSSIALLPLLFNFSYAAQVSTVDPAAQPWFYSDDGGGSAYLGVDISDVTTERLSALKLKEEKGVEVTMVDQDAPAGKAGIKEHDVILSMNGDSIQSKAQLQRMIHETPPGRVVTLGLSRDGQPLTLKVQLADKHKEFGGPNSKEFHFEMPEVHVPEIEVPAISVVMISSARSGLTVENITPQLGDFFGVKNGNGVLVRAVEKGSRAEKAGFRAGDVIVKINDQPVHDTSDFSHAVRSRGSSNSVNIGVIRDKKEQNLNLTIPSRKESGSLMEEESIELEPWMQAQSAVELTRAEDEIAKLRPQLEMAKEQAEEYSHKALEEARKATEEARKTVCEEQQKVRSEYRKQQQDYQKQQAEFLQQQKQLQRQLDQMRKELHKAWLEI